MAQTVCVIVLGDVGRSPRMQYHALSLAEECRMVYMVGVQTTRPLETLEKHPRVRLVELPEASGPLVKKTLRQGCDLARVLWELPTQVDCVLLQTPPAIPVLAVVKVFSALKGFRVVVDWHNFGYTILGMKLGNSHPLVTVAYVYERIMGLFSDGNFCVTYAMQRFLRDRWWINAVALHDHAPEMFRKLDREGKKEFFKHLRNEGFLEGIEWSLDEDSTAIVVSSTSYTPDEDFSILLEAIQLYDQRVAQNSTSYPNVLFVITGKGPLKDYYASLISQLKLSSCRILQWWLAAEDYPRLLGAADLGVSLHTSSSGLDLPMKVVDMLGSSLPVLAVNFECLSELIQHGENGLVFDSGKELSEQLIELLHNFPSAMCRLRELGSLVGKKERQRWNESWKALARPVILGHGVAIMRIFLFILLLLCLGALFAVHVFL